MGFGLAHIGEMLERYDDRATLWARLDAMQAELRTLADENGTAAETSGHSHESTEKGRYHVSQ